jgi:hypothetical protein
MLSKHITFVSFWSFCWKEKLKRQKNRVLEVNVWIRANSCMNSCNFLICYSQYHSLFKKSKISWNGWVLEENKLSVWDTCGDIFVRPMPMPESQKTDGCLCRAKSEQPNDQKPSTQGSHTESSFSTKTQPFQLLLDFLDREWYWLQHIEKSQEFM